MRLGERFRAWLANRGAESKRWQDATIMGSGQVWLTVEELEEFGAAVDQLVGRFRGRAQDRPSDARRVYFSLFAFPADRPGGGPASGSGQSNLTKHRSSTGRKPSA